MSEIFAWKASGWTSPTRPDGTISAFLPLPPLSHSPSRHFASYILFMCGFAFALQNGTVGIVGEIIALEWRQEVLILCSLFHFSNKESHNWATCWSQIHVILFLQGLTARCACWGRFTMSIADIAFSSPPLSHALSLPPPLWLPVYLKLCGWLHPWHQDLQKVDTDGPRCE